MNSKRFSSTITPAVDITGFGMVCPQPQPKMIEFPETAQHKSYPAYICSNLPGTGVLPAAKLRRLGHVQKMAITASSAALQNLSAHPESQERVAITVGTGSGALRETMRFLENMITNEERQPKPTYFINSVHNSIASQIAMTFGFKEEVHTFTQDAISFDLALWQALNILHLGRTNHVLTCGVDELNPFVLCFGERYMWWQKEAMPLSPMAEDRTKRGTIAGEGAAAFLLSRPGAFAEANKVARLLIMDIRPLSNTYLKNLDTAQEVAFINKAIAKADYTVSDVDFFLFGANGNAALDASYIEIERALSAVKGRNIRYGVYKQLCGEYCTASALGLAIALSILREGIPHGIEKSKPEGVTEEISNVLLYNLSDTGYHSICLVSL